MEEPFTFMVCRTICTNKTGTMIQVDTCIFLFSYCLFGVYVMIFIYMVILEEILFTFVIDIATIYHQSERDIPKNVFT